MFLSIIVPAYNVEKYIGRCLDSLLCEDSKDYEVIVVNDGSNDKTDEIIQNNYLDKVVYIKKEENSGLSDARNLGMSVAQGDYMIFVDSDDYVSSNYLMEIKQCIDKAQNIDLIYTGHFEERAGKTTVKKGFFSAINRVWTAEEFLTSELRKRYLPIPACFVIYRRSFITDSGIQFCSGILHEDELWAASILLKAKKILTSDLCFYHYVIRLGSITQKKDKTQNGIDMLFICDEMIKMSVEIKGRYLKRLFENHIAMLYMKAMCRGRLYRKEYRTYYDKWLPSRYAYFAKDRIKAWLFVISPRIYYNLDLKYGAKL